MSADVVTLGEALVALVADEGRPLSAPGTFTPFVAGAEANVAMGLARLGRVGRRSSAAWAPTVSGRWCAAVCGQRASTCAG